MFDVSIANNLKFKYVLMDIWFASNENFEHIASKNKEFIVAIKGNRLCFKNEIVNKS